MQYRVAIRFVIDGDLRFISHHDTMRLFERAMLRAQLPVKFSRGFNPRPRFSLPLPRAVGIAGMAELLVVDLEEPLEPVMVLDKLREQMPAGLVLSEARLIAGKHPPQPVRADYELALPPEQVKDVSQRIADLLSAPTWNIQRSGPGTKRPRVLDLRQYLADGAVCEGILRWTVPVSGAGSLRPAELLAAVGLPPEDWQHQVRRTGVEWSF
ncbi:MAG: TIGR03936 family radical SAM-associated protein [Phycisphaerae bacterium]